MKKVIKGTWEIIKAIYAIIGMMIIFPFAVITAFTQITYDNAKTYIQAKVRR